MAAITHALLLAFNTAFKASFQKGLESVEPDYEKFTTEIPSTTESNTYGWLGEMPEMREWIGDRVINDIATHGYSISNKTWESTIGIKRETIEDDQVGVYKPLFEEMGRAGKAKPNELSYELLKNGSTTLCYDGQNFFDAEHPVYPNHDGTGTAAMVSNLTDGTSEAWYLLDTSRAVKPVIFQNRRKLELNALTSLKDENVFMTNKYLWGSDARNNVGFSFWQLAHMSKQPLTEDSFNAAYTAMQSIKADGGRPLAIKPTLLIVSPKNRQAALNLIKAANKSDGASNTNVNAVDLLISPYLA